MWTLQGRREAGEGGGYGMVWCALRYQEWLAGRSLTLPVFRAGVRAQLAVTLGCCPPGSGGGGGGCCCAIPIVLPVPPCSCLLCWRGPRGPSSGEGGRFVRAPLLGVGKGAPLTEPL